MTLRVVKAPMAKPFSTETELCAAFVAQVAEWRRNPAYAHERDPWTCYAETGGWDILLSRDTDGFQIGVEAKLRFSAAVLAQCLEESRWGCDKPGPDCRAVLVPDGTAVDGVGRIAAHLGVVVITVAPRSAHDRDVGPWRVLPCLPSARNEWTQRGWPEWAPVRRVKLPSFVPDVPAGAPAPRQLTEWKIGALKLAVLMEERGHVTREDFRHVGVDLRRWLAAPGQGWIEARTKNELVRGKYWPRFDRDHPTVYAQIKADRTWRPGEKKGGDAELPLS